MRPIVAVALAGLTLCSTGACTASYPTAPSTPQVAALQIQYPSPTPDPRVGRAISLVAYSVDSDDAWTDVTRETSWYATDSSIIRTSPGSATLLPVGAGTTTVVASYGGVTDSIPIIVRPEFPASFPQLEFTNLSSGAPTVGGSSGAGLVRRESLILTTIFVTGAATWTSSNPAVASVSLINSSSVAFTAVAVGTTRITASLDGQSVSLGFSVAPRR